MAQVKLSYDNLPKDAEVEVPYLGVFKNGSTTTLEQFQVDAWEANTGDKFPGDGLSLPAPVDANPTGAQAEADLQKEIIERQNARSPEQAAKEERDAILAMARGEAPKGTVLSNGEVVASSPRRTTRKESDK